MTRVTHLLRWYNENRRRLPWRANPGDQADPYAVLVSELMCQQTRVETVIPHYQRWMSRWPTIEALCDADVQDALQMWTGLGYYRRARNLLKAAQEAVNLHGGLPADHNALLKLSGVGPYTAGALASIAFGIPSALVDGNVARVLSRWFAIDSDVSKGPGRRKVWRHADELLLEPVAHNDPGTWNQALMELGALTCTPRRPNCAICPVSQWCQARQTGRELELPIARKRPPPVAVLASCAVVVRDNDVLLNKRADHGRWAGLWEPPTCEGNDHTQQLQRLVSALQLKLRAPVGQLSHALTHRTYTVTVYLLQIETLDDLHIDAQQCEVRWSPITDALGKRAGVSRLGQRAIELALAP